MILVFDDKPLFAGVVVRIVRDGTRDRPYITMIQDGGETSHDRLERGKGVQRFLDDIYG